MKTSIERECQDAIKTAVPEIHTCDDCGKEFEYRRGGTGDEEAAELWVIYPDGSFGESVFLCPTCWSETKAPKRPVIVGVSRKAAPADTGGEFND